MSQGASNDPEVEALLEAIRTGQADASALYRQLYDELHGLARAQRARWQGNWTMNTTALVHEAYVKLVGKTNFESRAHVLATASRAMRQVLVSYAEARSAQKRGGSTPDLPLDEAVAHLLTDDQADEVLALNDALAKLAEADERAARIVECRYFGGLSVIETAEALEVSEATVTRGWRAARAWLYGELKDDRLLSNS
ncbi:ECF-type sigma factor [Rubrivirga sp.]|uniref:ECF-type sigma factor n=1 Tax=Rubrivirga sp. TaxID=1885344 RepID=UPI003C71CB30